MKYNLLFLLTLVLVACGPDGKHFKLEGRLLNLNQGEFLVYSPEGITSRIDTITVQGGRFEMEAECEREGVVVIMMPNGAEIPVFIKGGKSYSIKGDAQNLNELKIEGSKENELMNDFRQMVAKKQQSDAASSASDEKMAGIVADFVKKNPESKVSAYLVRRYLVDVAKPDTKKALQLIELMSKKQPDSPVVTALATMCKLLGNADVGHEMPVLNMKDIKGNIISDIELKKGITLICSYASWDYESTNQLRRIKEAAKEAGIPDSHIIALSLDATVHNAKEGFYSKADEFNIVCDGKMTDGQAASQLAISQTSTVVVIKDGKIIERRLTGEELYKFIRNQEKS